MFFLGDYKSAYAAEFSRCLGKRVRFFLRRVF